VCWLRTPGKLFAIKKAVQFSREKGPAVVIARHPCIIDSARRGELIKRAEVEVNEDCDGCGFCVQHFECPAMVIDEEIELMCIDPLVCTGCGVCLNICPKDAIIEKS
jgi:indolepyruvate ferredoxin oxidoreductase alpha subunit